MRKEQKIETLKRIHRAVNVLAKEKGIENIKIRDICEEANISIGTYYHYFKSLDDLVASRIEAGIKKTVEEIIPTLDSESAMENMKSYVHQQMRMYEEQSSSLLKETFNLYLIEDSPFVLDETSINFQTIHTIIQDGQKKNEFRNDFTANELTQIVLKLIMGNSFLWVMHKQNFSIVEVSMKEITEIIKK